MTGRVLLERLAVQTAAAAGGAAAALLAGVAWWVVSHDPGLLRQGIDEDPGAVTLRFTGVALVAALIGAGAGFAASIGPRRMVHRSSQQLLALSTRFAAGETRLEPLDSGIDEFDAVAEVMTRRAHDWTKSLAAERDFAADASHQLRTPLTALLMRLEEISYTEDVEVVHEEANIAISQVERLTRVVDDLLGRNRGAGGPAPAVSLDSIIAALQREWQPAFEQARRSVRVRGERGLFVRSTPVALSQVLSTLLENSLVHGRGTVDVRARRAGPSVIVEVSDEGDGVPAAMAPHIFERSVSSGTGGSTGLGLALARDLAEANGGRLDLVRAQPARFALFLSEAETD